MTQEKAKDIVKRRFPSYVIEYCVPYKNGFVVKAHPDNGSEFDGRGAYPDPFYYVDERTKRVAPFFPLEEKDYGRAFFEAVVSFAKTQRPVE